MTISIEWLQEDTLQNMHPSTTISRKRLSLRTSLVSILWMRATEIAKLRLFLALVASVQTVEQLEPLPNIDFNILPGNSLIGVVSCQ